MVKFKPGIIKMPKGLSIASATAAEIRAASVSALNAKHGVYQFEQVYAKVLEIKPDWTYLADDYVLIFPEDEDVEQVAADYNYDPNVESASPVSIVTAFTTTPDDPRFGQQYGLTNINAPLAWDRTTGSNSITVAVMDTGINYNHEDFSGRIDLANAYDFVNDDTDPMDDHGSVHGTGVSGVIGAATNNGKGVAGVDWQCKILPIKVLDHNGDGTMTDILQGLAWARAKNVDVINMSFGQYSHDTNLSNACQDAYDDGIVLVAAAGNGNVDWLTYPAYYSTVIAVGAVDSSDNRSVWGGTDPITGKTQASNYGSWVDCCAPGTQIWSVSKNVSDYALDNGTSFASPFVAGEAALIKAANPAFSVQQIIDKITMEGDVVSTDQPIGKRINAYLAVAGIVAGITSPADGAYVDGTIGITGSASGWDFVSYLLEAFSGSTLIATIENSTSSVEGGTLGSWDTTAFNGAYNLRLTVFSTGGGSEEASVDIFIDNTTPEAQISYPPDGADLVGKVSILGTARDQYFDRYLLEYGQGSSPLSYETISQSYLSVSSGLLGSWETSGLTGTYTIRLSSYDKVGNVTVRSVTINLQNSDTTNKEVEPQAGLPLTYALPNPFDRSAASSATLNYDLAGNFVTDIYLFDLSGNLVWKQTYQAGENGGKSGANNPAWDGRDLGGTAVAGGVYLYQIVADGKVLTKGKIIVLN